MGLTERQKQNADRFAAQAHAIRAFDIEEPRDMAFMGHRLVQVTLPHEDPGDVPVWGRENGSLSLTVQPGMYLKDGQPVSRGIPFGSYPRLVLAWITTEAVKTGATRRLRLGGTLTAFMREIGLSSDGRTGRNLREQMNRLFTASIRFNDVQVGRDRSKRLDVADEADLWWDPKRPDQEVLFKSTVLLTESFFHELTAHPVPVNMRALHALKASPLGLDLYMWLTYRVSYMKHETVLSWTQVEAQLGSNYSDTVNFANKAKRELKKIQLLWPALKVATPRGRLVLYPCPPHVKPRHVLTP